MAGLTEACTGLKPPPGHDTRQSPHGLNREHTMTSTTPTFVAALTEREGADFYDFVVAEADEHGNVTDAVVQDVRTNLRRPTSSPDVGGFAPDRLDTEIYGVARAHGWEPTGETLAVEYTTYVSVVPKA